MADNHLNIEAERAAFEAWYREYYEFPATAPFLDVPKSWIAWKARAALAARRPAPDGAPTAVLEQPAGAAAELPPIDYDRDMDRTYIPLPGGWEIQTKGKGSTFRIAHIPSRTRWMVLADELHEPLEALARDMRNALADRRQRKEAALPEQPAESLQDPLYDKAVMIVRARNRVATATIQRELMIGYNRASRLIEKMEEAGVVSPPNENGYRTVVQEGEQPTIKKEQP